MDYYDNGDIEKALECFKESIQIEAHFKTYERMFQIYKRLNKVDEAKDCIVKAFEMNCGNDKVSVEYAKILIDEGQTEFAEKLLNNVLKRNSSYGPATKLLITIKTKQS